MPLIALSIVFAVVATDANSHAVASENAHATMRVYVAPISAPAEERDAARLIEDRVLAAAKSANVDKDVVGARDVQGLLDAEAAKQALGCDSDSCADEIAGALNADELVVGHLGRIGATWQLSLARTERKTLRVLGRSTRTAHGDTPEPLLSDAPAMVAELFGTAAPGPSALFVAGVTTTSVGALTLLAGAALYGASWYEYGRAHDLLTASKPDVTSATQARDAGVQLLPYGYVAGGAGIVVAAIGGALFLIDAGSAP